MEYSSGRLWGAQIGDFIREVVHQQPGAEASGSSSNAEPVVLVGNSLGGYACMNAAAQQPDLVRWVVSCELQEFHKCRGLWWCRVVVLTLSMCVD